MSESPWRNDAFAELSLEGIDNRFAGGTQQQVEFLMDGLHLKPGDSLLDLGCGAGRHAIAFAQQGLRVTGIDISSYMLEQAKERASRENANIIFIQSDLTELGELQLQPGGYNAAICLCDAGIGVLGGQLRDYTFLQSIYSLLQDGSSMALSCLNALRRYILSRDHNPQFDFLSGTMAWHAEIDEIMLSEMQRQYAPSEITLLLMLCGFASIKILSCSGNIFTDTAMGIEDIEMLVLARKPNKAS